MGARGARCSLALEHPPFSSPRRGRQTESVSTIRRLDVHLARDWRGSDRNGGAIHRSWLPVLGCYGCVGYNGLALVLGGSACHAGGSWRIGSCWTLVGERLGPAHPYELPAVCYPRGPPPAEDARTCGGHRPKSRTDWVGSMHSGGVVSAIVADWRSPRNGGHRANASQAGACWRSTTACFASSCCRS